MSKIINITFCVREKMPHELMDIAMRQGLDCGPQDIVAIKTKLSEEKPSSPAEYEFEVVIPTPEGIRDYMAKLARQDGAMDWNEMLRRAFLEGERDGLS